MVGGGCDEGSFIKVETTVGIVPPVCQLSLPREEADGTSRLRTTAYSEPDDLVRVDDWLDNPHLLCEHLEESFNAGREFDGCTGCVGHCSGLP